MAAPSVSPAGAAPRTRHATRMRPSEVPNLISKYALPRYCIFRWTCHVLRSSARSHSGLTNEERSILDRRSRHTKQNIYNSVMVPEGAHSYAHLPSARRQVSPPIRRFFLIRMRRSAWLDSVCVDAADHACCAQQSQHVNVRPPCRIQQPMTAPLRGRRRALHQRIHPTSARRR